MSWLDQMQDGSFRGVPFLLDEECLTQIGRRGQLHEYPLRDTPYGEDLGRRARRFNVDCLVIGDDYMDQRDALIAALETKGAGTLVHPYYGTKSVVVLDAVEVRESTRFGGMARFRIPFEESGEKLEPATTTDTTSVVNTQSASAMSQLASSFANGQYTVSGLSSWVSTSALGDLAAFTQQLQSFADGISTLPAGVTAFNGLLRGFSSAVTSLVEAPFDLAAGVMSLVVGVGTMVQQPMDALSLYQGLSSWGNNLPMIGSSMPVVVQTAGSAGSTGSGSSSGSSSSSGTGSSGNGSSSSTGSVSAISSTSNAIQAARNRSALVTLVQGLALAQACVASATVPAQTQAALTSASAISATNMASGTTAGAAASASSASATSSSSGAATAAATAWTSSVVDPTTGIAPASMPALVAPQDAAATLLSAPTEVIGYDTAQAAAAMRDTLTDAIDTVCLTADDATYPQWRDLRAAVVADLSTRAATLPALVTFVPVRTLPALVIAYRLYGDATRAEGIVARNDLEYPGFVPGGQPLEVLSV